MVERLASLNQTLIMIRGAEDLPTIQKVKDFKALVAQKNQLHFIEDA
jgi:hypothetical protein